MTLPPEALPAATVVLLQDQEGSGPPSVFFVQRHRKSGFMPNAFVFPGGRVDEADRERRLVERTDIADADALLNRMAGLTSSEAVIGHIAAAVRETFEEAGVLLATLHGEPLPSSNEAPELWDRLDQWRAKINAGQARFIDLLEQENLRLDGSALQYFAHWITPNRERRRYDTRFFVARAPIGQRYRHDDIEVTDSLWLSAEDALERYHATTEFFLAPPTWSVLRDIRPFGDAAAVMGWAGGLDPVMTVQPEMIVASGGVTLNLSSQRRIVMNRGHWSLEER